jgi:hypothetical protein
MSNLFILIYSGEGGVNFMKLSKEGGTSYNSLGTSDIGKGECLCLQNAANYFSL